MPAVSDGKGAGPKKPRDPRLDVFRGLAMFIILIAHIPWNTWADWIPARFGFSDATEIFVFCSGSASAIAFGRVFDTAGWARGTARILKRMWQVYRAHIGVFIAIVASMALAESMMGADRYLRPEFNLGLFLEDPAGRLLGLVTLSYVPNYFDILPMYLVILALVPAVMAAARRSLAIVAGLVGGLWVLAGLRVLELPAETSAGLAWFFNPFSWQLLFFIGFAYGRGWLNAPSNHRGLLVFALMLLGLAIPFSCQPGWSCHAAWGAAPWLGDVREMLLPLLDKTHLGVLRVAHFLALAYAAYILVGEGGRRLRGPLVSMIQLVGRNSLLMFLSGLFLAPVLGVVLDATGRNPVTVALANLAGCALLVLIAALAERFKGATGAIPRAESAANIAKVVRPEEEPDSTRRQSRPSHDAHLSAA